jgi:superfamily II DNA helicase RecQ
MSDITVEIFQQAKEILNIEFPLRQFQKDAISAIFNNHLTVVSATTGSGKTLIIILMIVIYKILYPNSTHKCILVISPLISLITDMIDQFQTRYNIVAVKVDADTDFPNLIGKIRGGGISIVMCCPESYVTRRMELYFGSQSIEASTYMFCRVMDEVQDVCLCSAYREPYDTMCRESFSNAKLVFLSGSLTKSVEAELKEDYFAHIPNIEARFLDKIRTDPDRDNFYYGVEVISSSISFNANLNWILQLMDHYKDNVCAMPQVLIYFTSVSTLYLCHLWFMKYCPQAFRSRMKKYFAEMGDVDLRAKVIYLFKTKQVTVFFATVAAGEGLDFHNLSLVVLWGCPSTIESYLQLVGRGGRQGNSTVAMLYVYNSQNKEIYDYEDAAADDDDDDVDVDDNMLKDKTKKCKISTVMRNFVMRKHHYCYRATILDCFDYHGEPPTVPHRLGCCTGHIGEEENIDSEDLDNETIQITQRNHKALEVVTGIPVETIELKDDDDDVDIPKRPKMKSSRAKAAVLYKQNEELHLVVKKLLLDCICKYIVTRYCDQGVMKPQEGLRRYINDKHFNKMMLRAYDCYLNIETLKTCVHVENELFPDDFFVREIHATLTIFFESDDFKHMVQAFQLPRK